MRLLASLCCAAALAATAVPAAAAAPPDPNLCLTAFEKGLYCPDMVMDRPWGLSLDKVTKPGRTLLRAGNAIESIGRGPIELHGVRYNRVYMHARQRIYKREGGWVTLRTGAKLRLKFAHLSRYWWKYFNAASFQLWRLDRWGKRVGLARTGPKVSYCLRDLAYVRPWLRASPSRPHYPACNTNVKVRRDVLGISIGWADAYPPSYPEQWIDVTGLRGCFAYVHTADPKNGVYESNEHNNRAQLIVRLPYRSYNRRGGCRGRDRGRPYDPVATPYS